MIKPKMRGSLTRTAVTSCLLTVPLSAGTIARWDMVPTGGSGLSPVTLDLANAVGQGTKTGNPSYAASEDHLLCLNSIGDTFATSSTVPPSSMFRPGFDGGTASYDAASLVDKDGSLLFPQDVFGNEFALADWTVEVCFRSNGDQSGGGSQQILIQNEAALSWGLVINENVPGGLRLNTFNGANHTPIDLEGKNYADGQWHYAVISYNAATKVMKLRVRGEDGTVSSTQRTLVLDPYNGPAGNLLIGRNSFAKSGDHRTFVGLIDEIRISDTTVPDDELMGNLAGTPSSDDSKVIARWSMEANGDGTANPRVIDSRTATGEGTRTGSFPGAASEDHLWMFGDLGVFPSQQAVPPTQMMSAGKSPGAAAFDASYFAYPTLQTGALFFAQDAHGHEFAFTRSFTYELFFRTAAPDTGEPSNQRGAGLMQLLLNSENDMKSALIVNENAPGGIRFAINDSRGTIPVCDLADRNYADGTWHYVEATYDASVGTKGVLRVVVRNEDGSIDAVSVDIAAVYPNFVSLSPAFNNLFVGRNQFSKDAPAPRNFNGLIDEVQITKGIVSANDRLGDLSNLEAVAPTVKLYPLPAEAGTVTGSGTFDAGSTVQITAAPLPGYVFGSWTGAFAGQPASFTTAPLSANQTAVANFVPNTADADSDGLTDYQEIVLYGTDSAAADSDGDGLSDSDEVEVIGSNPHRDDSALVNHLVSAAGGVGTSITRDTNTGEFYLNLNLTESTDLQNWSALPVTPSSVSVSGGDISVKLPAPPSPAMFWRFNPRQGSAP
jgi:hypothetical protein